MLVLSRHRDEVIMVGDDIVITVIDIRHDKVRLGIEAPEDVQVHRLEVHDAIQRQSSQPGNGERLRARAARLRARATELELESLSK